MQRLVKANPFWENFGATDIDEPESSYRYAGLRPGEVGVIWGQFYR